MNYKTQHKITFITSEEYEAKFKGFSIFYGFQSTTFGDCLIAFSESGICYLSFIDHDKSKALELLKQEWIGANFFEDSAKAENIISNIFSYPFKALQILLKGTMFQINVWKALLDVRFGEIKSYQDIANAIGNPSAVRAVANAIAKNNISLLVPCHRIILKSGKIHKYRWGAERKKAILEYERLKIDKLI